MTEEKTKIGLYGGTFDPIHLGHINLAVELAELRGLDEVWFCPAQSNPHKTDIPGGSMSQRMAMVQVAVQDIPNFKVIDNEARRPAPSYTIDTLKELKEAYPNNDFYLLLGEDSISGFFRWYQLPELLGIAKIFTGSRTGEFDKNRYSGEDQRVLAALVEGLTQTRLMDISATMIRDRLSRGLYCGHLLPGKVIDYIKQNGLYSPK